jgi:transcriptional regulator with XRE-family HTH domain
METREKPLASRLSQNIAAQRRALGLTQAQLAERIGVDTETVSRFERGKHLPSLTTLERLAGVLLCTMADLLAEERPQSSDEAMMLSAWLAELGEEDREFAKGVLLQCCNYLGRK